MRNLNDDLSEFARAIVRGEPPSPQIDASYPLPCHLPRSGEGDKDSLREHHINYSLDVAVEVYRNNYRGNLHDALAGAYPVVEQLVGAEFFRLLTRKFIGQHDSHSGNLHHYGMELADFIDSFEPAQTLPYLSDVAALEWICHRSYFADDTAVLDFNKLAQVAPEQYAGLILHVHPACHLLRSRYPVAAIWHAHQPGAPGDFHIDLDSGPCNALVSRKQDTVLVNELSGAEAAWMQLMQAGIPLGEATAATQERHPDFKLQTALLNLVAQDMFSDFSLRTTP